MTATAMVNYFDQIIGGKAQSLDVAASQSVVQGLLDAMEMEGYAETKPPCNNDPFLINPDDVTCLHGAPWNKQYTQPIMGGDLPGTNMSINNNDNFHPVDQVKPVHLSEIDSDCTTTSKNCVMETITVTENYYADFDSMDTGYHPIAASEMKTKLSSRQKIQTHAGDSDADFSALDEEGNRCADINNASIQWAYDRLSEQAKSNYDNFGQKLVTGDDMGPYNAGPLWIWTLMSYVENDDKTTMTVSSPMMRTPTSYFVKSAAGFHYCKVLSPFKAMEWMMTDGLYTLNGIKNNQAELFLQ
jgi:hypothetical protein